MGALIRIYTLAGNTLREVIRNRILYVLLCFAIVLIATGVVLSALSYVEQERILQDVGLGSIRLFGTVIAIFLGVGVLHKEVDRRTIYTILSKPISRSEFVLGKYLGLTATIWLQLLIMSAAFALISWLAHAPLGTGHAAALLLSGLEMSLMVAVATLFSAFTTPMLASFFTAGIWVVGHLTRDLRQLASHSDVSAVRELAVWIHRLLPDLESFNVSIQAVHGLPIEGSEVTLPIAYGIGYASLVLILAIVLFERRDFR
ncbi:MAG: ABC transporter permease subunit [Deltaproteobacteria bacterium]|nr:MAG: ABC transporter permease subunit [Deltaproteobacteria bacterium]